MKKIISAMAMACLSFSCFAEDYFVKVADNEYVLQHGEKAENLRINKSGFGAVAPVDAVYTPTHIFTYPDETPSLFRNIQKIEYTESKVTFYKNMKTRKCCIDILDDKEGNTKCRIIGVNGHNIGSFEVYEAADDANSFTDSTPRLIFVDHTGLYIVEKDKNAVEDISKNYFLNRKFDFKGEIIKISAVDGKREVPKCTFKWPYDASVSFEESVSYSMAEFVPFMEQINKITGVMPEKAPPTWDAAKKRMAKILNIPEEMLVIEKGMVKLKNTRGFTSKITGRYGQLLSFVPFAQQNDNKAETRAILSNSDANYTFDTSPEAKKRRKEIALKPWDE
ncbi:MAG: hypothetical protein J6S86_01045 [Alphaproteobacteria bacterium]|nr:hypothetical protein [Alphaproteobacteria bacterium]